MLFGKREGEGEGGRERERERERTRFPHTVATTPINGY